MINPSQRISIKFSEIDGERRAANYGRKEDGLLYY
jgi:hypothetical protein